MMRRFSSYGPISNDLHYHAPRRELIETGYTRLTGKNPIEGGHYITVWAPRQCGKTWTLQQILHRLRRDAKYDVLKINLENLKDREKASDILSIISRKIGEGLGKEFTGVGNQDTFQEIFSRNNLSKPLILILDEFDALAEEGINAIVSAFRNIHIIRRDEKDKPTEQKSYLLHAVALIGVRTVLGIESAKGSPFNVQQSLHIPNLTRDEVKEMFAWYQKESGQTIEPEVVDRIYDETRGQPGLTCWLGEQLTEGNHLYANDTTKPIGMKEFEHVYSMGIDVLPNNNIINIISKADTPNNREIVLSLFNTQHPLRFRYDKKEINFLYMNGVIEPVIRPGQPAYARFASPFVQKRLFNYFSGEIFDEMGQLVDSFQGIEALVAPDFIDVPQLLDLYQTYLQKNKHWLFKNAPRRNDMRIYEAVFHFNLYSYLDELLRGKQVRVFPEFPTGNGKIDLVLRHNTQTYGIELKSFTDMGGYRQGLEQAAKYAAQLKLKEIYMVSFLEHMDEPDKKKLETPYKDPETNVSVHPFFILTGAL